MHIIWFSSFKIDLTKTVNERHIAPIIDTIEEDEIKEEINVVDDESDDENSDIRQRLIHRLSSQNYDFGGIELPNLVARQSKTSTKIK